jgi:hypothetical protein
VSDISTTLFCILLENENVKGAGMLPWFHGHCSWVPLILEMIRDIVKANATAINVSPVQEQVKWRRDR